MCSGLDSGSAGSTGDVDHDVSLLTIPSISIHPSSSATAPTRHEPHSRPAGLAANADSMNPPLSGARTFPLAATYSPNATPSSSTDEGPFGLRERAWTEPHLQASSVSSLTLTENITPTEEASDPLSVFWKQPPKQSSSLFRRLSRSGHRKSNSSPGELCQVLSEPPPDVRRDEEDDVVHVPEHFQKGIEMLRVTRRKITKRICSIDPVNACVRWDSKESSKCYFHCKIRLD